jgi:hypothetical protein
MPLLERFGYAQAFWVKGRKHNQNFVGRVAPPLDQFADEVANRER